MKRCLVVQRAWVACVLFSCLSATIAQNATSVQGKSAGKSTSSPVDKASKKVESTGQGAKKNPAPSGTQKPLAARKTKPTSTTAAKAATAILAATKSVPKKPARATKSGKAKIAVASKKAMDDSSVDERYSSSHLQAPVLKECGDSRQPTFLECMRAPRIWWQRSLAAVATGLDSNGNRVGRKYWLAIAGPAPFFNVKKGKSVLPEAYAKQAKLLNDMIDEVIRNLDADVPRPSELIEAAMEEPKPDVKATIDKTNRTVSDRVSLILHGAALRFRSKLQVADLGISDNDFELVIIDLRCEEAKKCVYFADGLGEKDRRFDRYAKLRTWARSKNANATALRQPYRLGLGPTNGLDRIELFATLRPAAHAWPPEVDANKAGDEFVRLAKRRRSKEESISFAAAEVLPLNVRSLLAVADVIDTPSLVFPPQADGSRRPAPSGIALSNISDEFARTRLLECQRLRGAASPEEVQACSGYLVDSKLLAACASGELCIPPPVLAMIGQRLELDLFFIAPRTSIGKLAAGNAFPRYVLGPDSTAMKAIGECYASDGGDTVKTVECINRKSASTGGRKTLDCLKTASDRSHGDRAVECALKEMSPQQGMQAKCFSETNRNAVGIFACMDGNGINSQVSHVLRCGSAFESNPSEKKLRECVGQDAGLAKKCYDKLDGKDGWMDAALCASDGAKGVPKELQTLATCYKNPSKRKSGQIGECLLGETAKTLGGDGAKFAACAIESNYESLATAICMAGNNLTRDQRIFLQCVAESGGDPVTSSTCTVGRLAVKELQNCKGKEFGKGDCFGPNNDLRKLAATLNLPIGPNSVVADIINLQLRVLDFVPVSEIEEIFTNKVSDIVAKQLDVIDTIRKGDVRNAFNKHIGNQISVISGGLVKIKVKIF
ncbi:hypothetical protein [Variovorax paradoxus]|uniref:hypothetical protein n=1 Tax=Variovorax paradoxus TaxID=34073 RepID=UPI00248078B0|nr:hypothetical protein [Variovorax paradoxus]WGT62479.1 hypothetical protein QHG62_20845 [Variovorax paradoxus]